MSMKDTAYAYATATALSKALDEYRKDAAAELKLQLSEQREETGQDRVSIPWAYGKAYVLVKDGRETIRTDGPGFLEFMREKGMTCEQVSPEWKDYVETVDGRVVWMETGETVPGCTVEQGAAYVSLSGLKASDRMAFIDYMRTEGLNGIDMPLLGGTND